MCQVNTDPMKSTVSTKNYRQLMYQPYTQCYAIFSTREGFFSQKVFLEVVVPPDIVSTGTSTDTTVVENKSATLECKARGVPKPSITWKREDGGEIIMRNANNEKNKSKDESTCFFPALSDTFLYNVTVRANNEIKTT